MATGTFQVICVILVLDNARRKVLHCNVTKSPTSVWTGHQVVEAFPWDTAPRFLLRDRDGKYGEDFNRRSASLGISQVLTAPRSPWQNAYIDGAMIVMTDVFADNGVIHVIDAVLMPGADEEPISATYTR